MKLMLTSVFVCLAALLRAETFTWYVDSADGDNARDGLTPDTAYKTIARALENLPTVQTTGNEYVFNLMDSDVDYTWEGTLSVGVIPRIYGVKFCGNREHPERVRLNGENVRGFLTTNSQNYEIAGCTFVNMLGGAIRFDNQYNLVEDCVFKACTNSTRGGALFFGYETTVRRCRFEDCRSAQDGGAVCSGGNRANLVADCTFVNNVSDQTGGALYIGHADSVVSNCVFISNESKGSANAYGGGAIAGSFSRLYNSYFTNNVSAVHGGHVRIGDSSASGFVTNCVFYGGEANNVGGALYVLFGEGKVVDCTFEANDTKGSGAALYLAGNRTEVVDCRFYGNGWDKTSNQGACSAYSATNVLVDCVFSNNYTKADGGAVCVVNTSVFEAYRCSFLTNVCAQQGGAIATYGNAITPVLSNCVFVANVSLGTGGVYGGGAAVGGYSLYGCAFTNNVSKQSGGAARFNYASSAVGCTFFGNVSANGGGAVECRETGCAFTNCAFTANAGGSNGGGLCQSATGLSAYGCRFELNAGTSGGGLYINSPGVADAPHLIRNCLFVTNGHATANCKGGGLYLKAYTFVDGCSFVNNFRWNGAGGLCFGSLDNVRVSNCLFYGNHDTRSSGYLWQDIGAEDSLKDTFYPYVDHCSVWKAYSGFVDGERGNRLLTAPPFVDYDGGDYHLAKGSACIDAGENAAWMTGALDLDNLRKRPRLVDGNGDGIATVDLGCYEYRPVPGMVILFR